MVFRPSCGGCQTEAKLVLEKDGFISYGLKGWSFSKSVPVPVEEFVCVEVEHLEESWLVSVAATLALGFYS